MVTFRVTSTRVVTFAVLKLPHIRVLHCKYEWIGYYVIEWVILYLRVTN